MIAGLFAARDSAEDGRTRGQLLGAALARIALWTVCLLVIAAGLYGASWLVGKLWVIILPVLLGLFFATVLWPAAGFLRRRLPDALASLVVMLGALLLLTGLGLVLAPQVASQSGDVADAVVAGIGDIQDWLSGPPFNLGEDRIGELVDQGFEQLQSNAQSIAGGVLVGVNAVSSILLNLVLALVLCFFYLKDGPKFVPWVSRLSGPAAAPHVSEVAVRVWGALSGFIRAQALVGLVDAVFIGIGLMVLGVPLALPLAVLIFFGAFIPIVGALVTGAVAALVALVTSGFTAAIIVVVLIVVVQQLEGNVLQPILVGRTLDLHAAVVILAVTAGGSLFGIVGAFLAVPLVAVVTTLIRYARLQLDERAVDPEQNPHVQQAQEGIEQAAEEAREPDGEPEGDSSDQAGATTS